MSKLTKKDRDVLDQLGVKDKKTGRYTNEEITEIIKEQELRKNNRKVLKKKRMKRLRVSLVIFTFLLIIFIPVFLFTDISKIKTVSVKGNARVKTNVILSLLDITPNKTFIFFDKNKTKTKLFKDPYIKDIEISQSFFYNVIVTVKEREEKYIFKENDNYYITGDDFVFIRKSKLPIINAVLFESFKIKEYKKAKKIKVNNFYLLNNLNSLIHTLNKNKCSVKKVIYEKSFPLVYLTDELYLEGRPNVIEKQIKELLKVLKKLNELNKKRGKIIIARNNYFSFKETIIPSKKETKVEPTGSAIKTKEAIST